MRPDIDFSKIKVGDSYCLRVSSMGNSYHKATVSHVTKTRFKLTFSGDREKEFNKKDGREYGDRSGSYWSRVHYEIQELNPETLELIQKSKAENNFASSVYRLSELKGHFSNLPLEEKVEFASKLKTIVARLERAKIDNIKEKT